MIGADVDFGVIEHLNFEVPCARDNCDSVATTLVVMPCCTNHMFRCTGHAVDEREGLGGKPCRHMECGNLFNPSELVYLPIPKGAAT